VRQPESDTAWLSNTIDSHRFFASPGNSISIIDSTKHTALPHPPHGGQPADDNNILVATANKPKRVLPTSSRLWYEEIHTVQPCADFL
jgi:hypothetical protein